MNDPAKQRERVLETVVEKLLDWAAANYTRSISNPDKPHAIIALNKSDSSTPDDQWSSVNATGILLSSANAQINQNPTFAKYIRNWRSSQIDINSMHDLLKCYYSTVHVIRLPNKSRYRLLDQQRNELHRLITECCATSYKMKSERHILPDVDELALYLSLAFDHFSNSLEEPFDFVQASLRYQPAPETFADCLFVFAKELAKSRGLNGQIELLFEQLTQLIASCLLLDSMRKQRIGILLNSQKCTSHQADTSYRFSRRLVWRYP